MGMLSMQRPNVDDDLTLLTDFGKTEALVVEVRIGPIVRLLDQPLIDHLGDRTVEDARTEAELRALVSPCPYSEVARTSYAEGWRGKAAVTKR